MTTMLNFQDFFDVESLEKHHVDREDNEVDFECECDFHIPFGEADALVFNSLLKNIGRKSMIIATIEDRQKQAKYNYDLYEKDAGDRFDVKCSNFVECQENHMHNTKNFYFSVRNDASQRKKITSYFDR